MTVPRLPLGQLTEYPNRYDPSVLFAIPRSESRAALGIDTLPFRGVDIWNAWELTWLNASGLPVVATARIRIGANSEFLVESKSLKLYLGSFAMSCYDSAEIVCDTIKADLCDIVVGDVTVCISPPGENVGDKVVQLPGRCLDDMDIRCETWDVDATLLCADADKHVDESVHTHLFRSLCPVTSQPDIGSLAIRYVGPKIDSASLLRYVVSYREHSDFHEACIERLFLDVLERCQPEKLSLNARFQRRGGLDINPFRSNFEDSAKNDRLWRQ